MSWIYLFIAGLFEIGWPLGLKISQAPGSRLMGIFLAVLAMVLSGIFLWLAQRDIPIGTAYAVWTGIGAAGTFFVGVWFFGDATNMLRYFGVILIITGVAVLRVSHVQG